MLFDKAAKEIGHKPFPYAAANTSQPYKNPYRVQMGECTYCASDSGSILCRSGTTAMNPSTPITKANATPN